MTIQMKATEQYFPVVLFIMLYRVVLKFDCCENPKKSNLVLMLFLVSNIHVHVSYMYMYMSIDTGF